MANVADMRTICAPKKWASLRMAHVEECFEYCATVTGRLLKTQKEIDTKCARVTALMYVHRLLGTETHFEKMRNQIATTLCILD